MDFFVWIVLVSVFAFLSHTYASNTMTDFEENGEHLLNEMLQLRQNSLRRFVLQTIPHFPHVEHSVPSTRLGTGSLGAGKLQCPTDRFVVITGNAFGRTGNRMIEFTNGLWVAEKLHSTLICPDWMMDIFVPFNSSLLDSRYCYAIDYKSPSGAQVYEISLEDIFFAFRLYNKNEYRTLLPPMHGEKYNSTLRDLSLHFLRVYAALWSSPHEKLLRATKSFIYHFLDGNFRYNAIHKRMFEGACSYVLGTTTQAQDYSINELPMTHPEWKNNLETNHPICEMSYSFVTETLKMHHRDKSKLFVAHDGSGNCDDYKAGGAIFSSVLKDHPEIQLDFDYKFLDMFLAMHSDLFIMNPYSTFSWQVFLVRVILSLDSLPKIKNSDFYLQSQSINHYLWVSWCSVIDATLKNDRFQ